MQDTRQHQQVYLDNGYKYVVLTYDIALGFYDVTHFKSRKNAERFNNERLHGDGQVLTIQQLVKEYECYPL